MFSDVCFDVCLDMWSDMCSIRLTSVPLAPSPRPSWGTKLDTGSDCPVRPQTVVKLAVVSGMAGKEVKGEETRENENSCSFHRS